MTIRLMRFACWITKATDMHSEYLKLLIFHGHNGYANVPQRYVYTCIVCVTTRKIARAVGSAACSDGRK
jgi:hypothetical protein